ncbi:MAG: Gfo/Idh/MocA family oxidoreductase [Thalassovita sp.]
MTTKTPTRVAIVGTGTMARSHVAAYKANPDASLVAAVDTRPDVLAAFCKEHDIAHAFTSIEALLEWGAFDGVSNVTPDAAHHATSLPFLRAGKHVLCEKPLAATYDDAREMADVAAQAGVVNMINLSYRDGPALQKAAQMVAEGAIGAVRHFEASYLQSWLTQPAWGDWKSESTWLWRLSSRHGSKGVLGDVGIHIIDFATFVIGAMPTSHSAKLHTFHKAPNDQIGEYPLDANDSFVMHLQCENGALGTISATRFASGHHNDLRLRIYGVTGGLEVFFEKGESRLNACLAPDLESQTWHEVALDPVDTVYQKFIAAIRGQGSGTPDFERGAELQKLLSEVELSGT